MAQPRLKLDLKRLANSQLVENVSKQLSEYEKKIKKLMNDFDLKSRDARSKGQKQIDRLALQFRRTRGNLEKRVSGLLQQEGQRLNQGVSDLFSYLRRVAKSEKLSSLKAASKKKTSKKGASKSRKARPRKPAATAGATVSHSAP